MACVAAEDYHSADYPLPDIPPRATIRIIPGGNAASKQSDLRLIFGSRDIASEALSARTGQGAYPQTGGILRRPGRSLSISRETFGAGTRVAVCKRSSPVA
jgi:hypothetical protein